MHIYYYAYTEWRLNERNQAISIPDELPKCYVRGLNSSFLSELIYTPACRNKENFVSITRGSGTCSKRWCM